MNAAVKCKCEIDEVVGTKCDGSIKSIIAHQVSAANLSLDGFKRPVVLSALPDRAWPDEPAEHSLRPPRHGFVRIHTYCPAIRKMNFRANHEVGDFTQR